MNLGKSIDLYQIHSVTPESSVLNDKDVIKELHSIKKGGVDIGISTSGPQQKETITELLEINKSENYLLLFNVQSIFLNNRVLKF